MNCPTDAILRSRMDRELGAPECVSIDQHLGSCADCRARLAALTERYSHVRDLLNALAPGEKELPINQAEAFARFHESFASFADGQAGSGTRAFGQWKRPAWGALAAALAIALIVSFAPARTWAQKILEMLRVQKVAVVPLDISVLENSDSHSAGKLLAQMISDNVVVTMKPGEPKTAPTAEAASQMAGFMVRTLTQLGSPEKISVRDEAAFHLTLDRDRMQDVLDQAGRSDIQIPESANGSTIAAHIGKVVRLDYGTCQHSAAPNKSADRKAAPPHVASDNCMSFVQAPSPIVSVPPTLNVAGLAEAALQVAGMSAAEAHAFCETVDWSSTLVIPLPRNRSSSRTVPVDGVNGTLIETNPHGRSPGEYALVWVKNGIIYSLAGTGAPDRALAAADSIS
jgi:anti-sigma factor RsiW